MSKNIWKTEWTGTWPCLCCGEWILYKNGKKVDTNIPFGEDDAGTYGSYDLWSFGEDYSEEWEEYEDGMDCNEWIEAYKDWLKTIAEEDEWEDIFGAFQINDWRRGSCGGCI